MSDYTTFLESKSIRDVPTGKRCSPGDVHEMLFDFQKLIVAWAVRRGRAAIFAGCGLGKTLMQLEWARIVGGKCLIFTPLAVSAQTIREAKKIDIEAVYAHDQSEASQFTVTNYERISKFDPAWFDSVVLDESGILKSVDGKTRTLLIEMFQQTPFRLCCTATPAPNDHSELANHAEFLGVMSRAEMLATFFVHDDDGWRLKGHAAKAFWKWIVSWAVCLNSPKDVGCDDKKFRLPELRYDHATVQTDFKRNGRLFGSDLSGIRGRIEARKATTELRVERAAEIANGLNGNPLLIWCGLNRESELLTKCIKGAVEVKGSDKAEFKERTLLEFADGKIKALVSKPSIAGHGMNFQNCSDVFFVGLSDSFEEMYQAVRRSWRFGQKNPVTVYIITADAEQIVVTNIQKKEKEFQTMQDSMIAEMSLLETQELKNGHRDRIEYEREIKQSKEWTMHLGDACEASKEIETDSIDFSICSPPFAALYTYTNSERDMGNCQSEDEFLGHYEFLCREWLRITKDGRLAAVHVAQIPAMLSRDGYIGMKDFRGSVIRAHQRCGWIYHGEIAVNKNPQAQSIRTKAKGLGFRQLESDASWMRPALADFVLLFRKPGENQIPVKPEVTRDQWIEYAAPCWFNIRETDTLTVAEAREEKDERHICPLQLGLIDRCVRLWSNKGETVFSPFAGIGSEGYQSILRYRKFIGVELKRSYWKVACDNLNSATSRRSEGVLFDLV